MMQRRYRDGRLVRARRLRRASLQNERNLVIKRIAGMVEAVNRFALMVQALGAADRHAAVVDSGGSAARGMWEAPLEDVTEPDTRGCASTCGR